MFARSGGGAWELAGLIFDVGGYSGQPSPALTAVFGNATYSVDLAFYRPQIMAIVPEPTHGWLPAAIVAAYAAFRVRRRLPTLAVDVTSTKIKVR